MYEVEVKVRADHERVRNALASIDAEPVGTVTQIDSYFDAPHRNFAETDEALRIRRETQRSVNECETIDNRNTKLDEVATNEDTTDRDTLNEDTINGDTADGAKSEVVQKGTETTARLTYKGPLVEAESKTREEVETGIADGDDVSAILEALGFTPAATVRKERERFEHNGFIITLDAVDGLGEFLEVETEVETKDAIESRRTAACTLLDELGFDPDEQIRTSYLGLLLASDNSSS